MSQWPNVAGWPWPEYTPDNKNPRPRGWPRVLDGAANGPINDLELLLLWQLVDRAATTNDLGDRNRRVEQVVVRAILLLVVDLAGATRQQRNTRYDGYSDGSFEQLFHTKSFK